MHQPIAHQATERPILRRELWTARQAARVNGLKGLAMALWSRLRPGARWQPIRHALVELDAKGLVYAIGDIHGRADLLRALLKAIEADIDALAMPARIVVLGDMIDRGPDSAAVLADLIALNRRGRIDAVMGNHERMMLDFFFAPRANVDWLMHGGRETLISYGFPLAPDEVARMSLRRLSQALEAYVPRDHLDWLQKLPLGFVMRSDGREFVLAHAGFSPRDPLDRQPEEPLLWGPGGAPNAGQVLVHGHYVVDRANVAGPRIGIDTGAWTTGILTALRLCPGRKPKLIQTGTAPRQASEG